VDDPADREHAAALNAMCAETCIRTIIPPLDRVRSLLALFTGDALTQTYYRDRELAAWVAGVVVRERITRCVVFSSGMAQYVQGLPGLRKVVDFVDVDSAKWAEYAERRPWPVSWIYRREGEKLLAYERRVATRADAALFVTAAEADLFGRLAPECAGHLSVVGNGVDGGFFSPEHGFASPYGAGEQTIVFTGAMDYWPNIDAVSWFARESFPEILAACPAARFCIVGMRPAPVVKALARHPAIRVTGWVPDTRPYLAHARVVIAPLRVARGIQNKVLEAMAMARPVVVSQASARALDVRPGSDVEVAETAGEFARKVLGLLSAEQAPVMGQAARRRVLDRYSWERTFTQLDQILAAVQASPGASSRAASATQPALTARSGSV
jgi:sugar transferase (PEP-CTERM/EpsH1 system associated)